ncbi:uncharacterized protein [Maniola hyperantus]|uniref:uncharacterized protein n=1 Tax=Aphantopus hyperantus TaxID=2795564 RepID=UPI00213AA631
MEALAESIADFVRVRQLNIAVVALLTMVYLLYQYRDMLFTSEVEKSQIPRKRSSTRLSRSRSRSCSKGRSRSNEDKARRGKRGRRCPRCNSYDCDSS